MRLYLIRHAHAGSRTAGGHDLYRPLTATGRTRASQLADLLGDAGVVSILSSPASRCVQTVEPLAERVGIEVTEQPDLWEGSPIHHVLALLEQERSGAVAACSHGDVIPEVVETIAARGAIVTGRACEKGSVWVLDHDGHRWVSATYLDPSSVALPASLGG